MGLPFGQRVPLPEAECREVRGFLISLNALGTLAELSVRSGSEFDTFLQFLAVLIEREGPIAQIGDAQGGCLKCNDFTLTGPLGVKSRREAGQRPCPLSANSGLGPNEVSIDAARCGHCK